MAQEIRRFNNQEGAGLIISRLSPAQVQVMKEESYTVKTLTAGEWTTEGEKQNLYIGSASTLKQLTDAKSRFKDYSNAKSAMKLNTGREMAQNTKLPPE